MSARPELRKYRKIVKPKEKMEGEPPKDEFKVNTKIAPKNYISKIIDLLESGERKALLQGRGKAISRIVAIAEVVKRRVKGLHSISEITTTEVVDSYEKKVESTEGPDRLDITRYISGLCVTLTLDMPEGELPAGYQAPIPEEKVQAEDKERRRLRGPSRGRGSKGRGRGRVPRSRGSGGGRRSVSRGGGGKGYGSRRGGLPSRGRGGYQLPSRGGGSRQGSRMSRGRGGGGGGGRYPLSRGGMSSGPVRSRGGAGPSAGGRRPSGGQRWPKQQPYMRVQGHQHRPQHQYQPRMAGPPANYFGGYGQPFFHFQQQRPGRASRGGGYGYAGPQRPMAMSRGGIPRSRGGGHQYAS